MPYSPCTISRSAKCASLTGTKGTMDLNGQTITVTGNVTLDHSTGFRFYDGSGYSMSDAVIDYDGILTLSGADSNLFYIEDLDLINTGSDTPTATYCHVTNSIRTGAGPNINATDGTNVNNGGNTGWSFTAGGATVLSFEAGYGRGFHRGYSLGCR